MEGFSHLCSVDQSVVSIVCRWSCCKHADMVLSVADVVMTRTCGDIQCWQNQSVDAPQCWMYHRVRRQQEKDRSYISSHSCCLCFARRVCVHHLWSPHNGASDARCACCTGSNGTSGSGTLDRLSSKSKTIAQGEAGQCVGVLQPHRILLAFDTSSYKHAPTHCLLAIARFALALLRSSLTTRPTYTCICTHLRTHTRTSMSTRNGLTPRTSSA